MATTTKKSPPKKPADEKNAEPSSFMRYMKALHSAIPRSASGRDWSEALREAAHTAVKSGMRFEKDDFIVASKRHDRWSDDPRNGVGLDTSFENLYRTAIDAGNATALTALEHAMKQPRWIWDGNVLMRSSTFLLPQPREEGSDVPRALALRVTAIEGDTLRAVVQGPNKERRGRCAMCHTYVHCEPGDSVALLPDPYDDGTVEERSEKRRLFKFSIEEFKLREKQRLAVREMFFEAFDPADGRTMEISGKEYADKVPVDIPAASALEIGQSLESQGARARITRITCLTSNILERAAGYHSIDKSSHLGLSDADKKNLDVLVTMGLLAREGEPDEWRTRYTLTEAGRARLRLLGLDAETKRREQEESDRRMAELRRQWEGVRDAQSVPPPPVAEFTDAELDGVIVTFRDSIESGNCRLGTAAWIERNAPGQKSMSAKDLWTLAKEKKDSLLLVARVLRVAIARNKRAAEKMATARETASVAAEGR